MLLLDVSNILHTPGVLPPHLAGPDLRDLIRLIAASRYASRPLVLACDGGPPHAHELRDSAGLTLRVLHAGPALTADDLLLDLIEKDPNPARLIVVSTDRQIRAAAKRHRAGTLTSEQFLHQLALDADRPRPSAARPAFATDVPLHPAGRDYWLRYFGMAPGEPSALPALPPEPPAKPLPPEPLPPPPRRTVRAIATAPLGLPAVRPASPPADRPVAPPERLVPPEPGILWPPGLRPDDLDMERWLRTHPPPGPAKPSGSPGPAKPGGPRRGSSRRS